MKKIILVEDDTTISEELTNILEHKCYEITSFANPLTALEEFSSSFDLVLLDVNLPNMNGFQFAKEIRKISRIPILFLTSRNTPKDEAESILVGGDDYIIKPYDIDVLVLKMQRLLEKKQGTEIIKRKDVILDLPKSFLVYQNQEIILTRTELQILYYLFTHEEVCKKEDIITYLWDDKCYIDENALNVNITRLRKKLADLGLIDFIITVPKEGYRL